MQEEIVSFLWIKCLKKERKQKEEKQRKEGMFSCSYKGIDVLQNVKYSILEAWYKVYDRVAFFVSFNFRSHAWIYEIA